MKKIFLAVISLACSFGLVAQNLNKQYITGVFNQDDIVADDDTYVFNGKIDCEYAKLNSGIEVTQATVKMCLEENFNNATFDIMITLGDFEFTLNVDQGSINILSEGNTENIYSDGFAAGDCIAIGKTGGIYVSTNKSPFLVLLNDEVIGQINSTKIIPLHLSAKLVPTNTNDLVGEFSLCNSFSILLPTVNFVETEYYVAEGEAVEIPLELSPNKTMEVDLTLNEDPSPFLDDFIMPTIQFTGTDGDVGSAVLNLQTDLANGLEDGDKTYTISITEVSDELAFIGQKHRVIVHVIDDFNALDVNLSAGDLMFKGFDNEIDPIEHDQLIITNLTDIIPGTKFQIIQAEYDVENARFSKSGSGDFPIAEFQLVDDNTIPTASSLCMTIKQGHQTNTMQKRSIIELNGELISQSDDVILSLEALTMGAPKIDLDEPTTLFITQGSWVFESGYAKLFGNIIHGIKIGDTWEDGVDLPPSIECFEVEGPQDLISQWAYYECGESGLTIDALRVGIADFSNWTSGPGDEANNLPEGICANECTIVEYEPLAWIVEPTDLFTTCDSTEDPYNSITDYLNANGYSQVSGGCSALTFEHDFVGIDPYTCGTYEVNWIVSDVCGNELNAFSTINVFDDTAPTFNTIPNDITVSCGEVPDLDLIIGIDECDNEVDITFDDTIIGDQTSFLYKIHRTFTLTDNCGNTNSEVSIITIFNNTISLYLDSSPSIICGADEGEISIFSDIDGNTVNPQYLWNTGETTETISDFINQTTEFSLTVTDGYCHQENSIEVAIQNPIDPPHIEFSNYYVCTGVPITFEVAGWIDPDHYYTWELPQNYGGYDAHSSSLTWQNFPYPGTIVVNLTIVNNGCEYTDSALLHVSDPPELEIINSNPSNCACTDEEVTIEIEGCSTCVYEWELSPDGNEEHQDPNLNYNTFSWNTPGTKTIDLTVTDISGCVIEETFEFDINEIEAFVDQSLFIICEGQEISVVGSHVILSDPTEPVIYTWKDPMNNTIASGEEVLTFIPLVQGYYHLEVSDYCTSGPLCQSIVDFFVGFESTSISFVDAWCNEDNTIGFEWAGNATNISYQIYAPNNEPINELSCDGGGNSPDVLVASGMSSNNIIDNIISEICFASSVVIVIEDTYNPNCSAQMCFEVDCPCDACNGFNNYVISTPDDYAEQALGLISTGDFYYFNLKPGISSDRVILRADGTIIFDTGDLTTASSCYCDAPTANCGCADPFYLGDLNISGEITLPVNLYGTAYSNLFNPNTTDNLAGHTCADEAVRFYDSDSGIDVTFIMPAELDGQVLSIEIQSSTCGGPPDFEFYNTCSHPELAKQPNSATISRNSSASFRMFPNPAVDQIQLHFDSEKHQDVVIEIVDVNAIVQLEQEFHAIGGKNEIEVSTQSLLSGVYIVRFIIDSEHFSAPLLIIKD